LDKETYTINTSRASLFVKEGSQDLLNKVFSLLENLDFKIQTDQRILEKFPTLSDSHWEGNKGELLFKAEIYPAGFKIEFYQEVNKENPNGGYYDFNRFELMPYLIKCQFILTRDKIKKLLDKEGFKDESEPDFKYAYDNVMYRIKSCYHYKEGKELPSYEVAGYNATDKNGKHLYNGQIKCFRDSKGRLMRGKIYYNLNNMWWIILSDKQYTNKASFSLFDLEDEEDKSRKVYTRKMPYSIRVKKARDQFNSRFDYSLLREVHINHLRLLVSSELAHHDKEIDMSLKQPLKKDTVVRKTLGLKYAKLEVNGSYFSGREGITFNENGFIGFAGWASSYNLKPFAVAFEKWIDWLDEAIENKAA
jgi:hypothetical protein